MPIVGERFDGHDFIPQAMDKGAIAVLAENEKSYTCPVIYVDSTIKALLAMAKAYRAIFDIPVVGITGSTGKTTTKELVANVLSQKFDTLKNEKELQQPYRRAPDAAPPQPRTPGGGDRDGHQYPPAR